MNRLRRVVFRWTYNRHWLRPSRIIVIGSALLILLGAGLLTLPVATRAPGGASFLTALFTATSAFSVTGLIVQDTFTYWSLFGQFVILALIQIGGLGFIALMALVSFALRRQIGLRERLIMVHSFNLNDLTGVVRLTRLILLGTLLIEAAGAIVLASRFIPAFGWKTGLYYGVFHSISSFCNAGFDLMGQLTPRSSLFYWGTDPVIMITVPLLIFIGELGFFVWEDFLHYRQRKRLHPHTKIVLLVTAVLMGMSTLFFAAVEWNNPETLGSLSSGQKVLSAFFQSATMRTAGYSAIDQTALTESSKIVSLFLMFIGGSPGSTAGGIKTISLAIILLTAIAVIRGKPQVHAFRRGIPLKQIMMVLSMTIVVTLLLFVSVVALSLWEPEASLAELLFEATSAIGTVGVSLGLTPTLAVGSQLTLIFLMFFGRVGMITLGFAIVSRPSRSNRIRYPESKLIIG